MQKRIKSALIAVVVIAGVLLMVNIIIGPGFARFRAELAFSLFRDDFDKAAQGGDVRPFGVWDVIPYEAQEYLAADEQAGYVREGVEFQTGAWGFGSQTSYFGIVYAPEDLPLGFQCVDLPLIPEGESWYWSEEQAGSSGDNWQRIIKEDDHWYYYEMHF